MEKDTITEGSEAEIDFTAPWSRGNKVLLVEDKKLFVNETILGMSSPVMEAMFTGDFKEKGEEEITLPEKTYQDVYELMKVIHPPGKKIDDSNVYRLLPLAEEYQMKQVKRLAEEYLVAVQPSFYHLDLSDRFSLTELRKICIQFAKKRNLFQSFYIEDAQGFKNLNKDTKIEVLELKVKSCERAHVSL